MRTLACRDVGFDCDAIITAETDDEVLALAAVHARTVHGLTVTAELAAQVQALIREASEDNRPSSTAA